jgi:hypothetical protein
MWAIYSVNVRAAAPRQTFVVILVTAGVAVLHILANLGGAVGRFIITTSKMYQLGGSESLAMKLAGQDELSAEFSGLNTP